MGGAGRRFFRAPRRQRRVFFSSFLCAQEEFRLHFKNISRIMDCVGCSKCRLWGKLQVRAPAKKTNPRMARPRPTGDDVIVMSSDPRPGHSPEDPVLGETDQEPSGTFGLLQRLPAHSPGSRRLDQWLCQVGLRPPPRPPGKARRNTVLVWQAVVQHLRAAQLPAAAGGERQVAGADEAPPPFLKVRTPNGRACVRAGHLFIIQGGPPTPPTRSLSRFVRFVASRLRRPC